MHPMPMVEFKQPFSKWLDTRKELKVDERQTRNRPMPDSMGASNAVAVGTKPRLLSQE
jgi:hypothetical protein